MTQTRDPITGQKFDKGAPFLIEDKDTGEPETQKSTNGFLHVRTIKGTGLMTKNRIIPAAATDHPGDESNNSCTWTAAENVTEVTVTVQSKTAGAAQADDMCLVLFDAIDGAHADLLLGEGGGTFDQDLDVQFDMIPSGTSKTYNGTSHFTRVDVLPLGDVMRVVIGAQ